MLRLTPKTATLERVLPTLACNGAVCFKNVSYCLLLMDKTRGKDKTYI
jgi:hypothetical protein